MDQATIDLITGAVDFSLIIPAVGVIAVAVAGVLVAKRGAGLLLGAVKGR